MLARYPSMERFIRWYRQQIECIEAGELKVPAHLVYEDEQLDLPRRPGPDAVSVEELRWRTSSVRLKLTIWRPNEFSQWRYAEWIRRTTHGAEECARTSGARHNGTDRTRAGIHANPHAYFVEAHLTETMPWFMGPVAGWHARLGRGQWQNGGPSSARIGTGHAGVGTPEEWLVSYLGHVIASDRQRDVHPTATAVCFDPEATYRGVLFGTAAVTLMLTADARIHEILQISADRFVKPVRVYIVKNRDGTPKRDPATNRIVTDVIVEHACYRRAASGTTSGCSTTSARRASTFRRSRTCSNPRTAARYRSSRTTPATRRLNNLAPSGTYCNGTHGISHRRPSTT
jgi:hypothetical protein